MTLCGGLSAAGKRFSSFRILISGPRWFGSVGARKKHCESLEVPGRPPDPAILPVSDGVFNWLAL